MENRSGCKGLCSMGGLESVGLFPMAASKILSPKRMHMVSMLVGEDGEGKDAT